MERRRLELARRLDPAKYDQQIICLFAQDDMLASLEDAGVHVEDLRSELSMRSLARTAAFARRFKPDIVHGAVFEGLWMSATAKVACSPRHHIIEEIDFPIHRSWRGNLALRGLAATADACVGVSPAVMTYLRDVAHVPAAKLRLIMNGVAPPALVPTPERAAIRARLGIDPDRFVIGSIGRIFDSHKRFSDLMAAVALLRRQHAQVHLLIVGSGPDLPMLERRRAELGLTGHVTFAGYQSDVGSMLSIMDAFALASERESFGLVLAEAMFASLPVVATRAGGIPDVVAENETGLLVPVGDPGALAAALERIIVDDALRNQLGRAGLARASAHFSAERYVRDVDALYSELGAGRA